MLDCPYKRPPVSRCAAIRPDYEVYPAYPDHRSWPPNKKQNTKFVSGIFAYIHNRTRLFCLKVAVGHTRMACLAVLDSGTTYTLVEEELFVALNGKYVSKEPEKITSILRSPVPNVGQGVINLDIGQGIEKQPCVVISREVTLPTPIILGVDFIFRKEVVVRPAFMSDGSHRLLLTFGGVRVNVEEAPDGCIGEYPEPENPVADE